MPVRCPFGSCTPYASSKALAQSCSSPFWGTLIDRGHSAKALLVMGSVAWGVCTISLAFTSTLRTMLMLRILNGVALATLMPVSQAIIGDLTLPSDRGKYFGFVGFATCMGSVLGSVLTTSIANRMMFGIMGWRVAFAIVGGCSFLLASLLSNFLVDHRKFGYRDSSCSEEVATFLGFFRVRSFVVIVMQGCFGSVPWSAMQFLTMFYQYAGIPDGQAGLLTSCSMVCGAFGNIAGGLIGDRLTLWSRFHGRPLTAQISVFAGIPIIFATLHLVPREPSSFVYYLLLQAMLGLCATWTCAGVNRPLLTEVVPQSHQARILAWLVALEGSSSACFGAPFVGYLAEHYFGYRPQRMASAMIPEAVREANTHALACGMLVMTVLPWLACFMSYSFLHITYQKDVEDLQAQERNAATSSLRAKAAGVEVATMKM